MTMFKSTLEFIYTIVLPKPSFQVPPSKPDPVYFTATHFPTNESYFEVSRTPDRASRRRGRSNSVKTTSSLYMKTPDGRRNVCAVTAPHSLAARRTESRRTRRNTICSRPYEISQCESANRSLPYQLPDLEFMSAVASSLLLESPAHRPPTHSTPRRTPHRRRAPAPTDSPTPLTRDRNPRKDLNRSSSGSPYIGRRKRHASIKENDSSGPPTYILGHHLPNKRSLDDDSDNQSIILRRYSGRIVSAGSSSFLEALRRSSLDSPLTFLDDPPNPEAGFPLSVNVQQESHATVSAPVLAFTLDLSPIIEDLHLFNTDGFGSALPTLPSLATVWADSAGYMPVAGDVVGILGAKESEVTVTREFEACENGNPYSDVKNNESETRAHSEARPSLDTARKPSLVLQRASIAFSDEDQSLAHLPALTLTRPTPELSSKPILEAMNPLLTNVSEYRFGNAMETPADFRPILKPMVVANQSVSSLSLSLAPQVYSVPVSPSSSQYLQPPSPLAGSSALMSHSMRVPSFPRCTSCGFGFGSGFDVASSSDMLNISRVPCERCEEQWRKCVQWYAGGVDAKPGERWSRVTKRFSWLPVRKKEDVTSLTNKNRRSLSIVAKRISIAMPTVTTQTVTTVEPCQDEVGAATDELRRKFYRKATVSTPRTSLEDPAGLKKMSKWKKRLSSLLNPTKISLKQCVKPHQHQTSIKRYSTIGVQTEDDEFCGERLPEQRGRPLSCVYPLQAPSHPRVSGDSKFREEDIEEDEAFQDAMDALPPLRYRYL